MSHENLELRYHHQLPIRDASRRELAILEQAAQALPGDLILPEIRAAMMQRYPIVDDEELVVLRKSELPLGAWIGLCKHVPRGSPSQLLEDDEGPVLVVERSILDMILDALSALIQRILGMLASEKSGPPMDGKPNRGSGGDGKPQPRRSQILIEHDGPGF